jgi:ABC-type branched-subunit amino acid transport system ATPase component
VTNIGRRFGVWSRCATCLQVREGGDGADRPQWREITLFEIISGNLPPTTGTVRYFGRTAHCQCIGDAARAVSTFQKVRLFASMTVLNIAVAARHRADDQDRAHSERARRLR